MFQSKRSYLIVPLILFFLVCTLYPILNSSAFAEEKSSEEVIKTVILKKEPAGISPKTLKVKLGTTIVWLNNDPGPITIKFIEKLGIACKAPVNFYADLWGHYETGKLSEGADRSTEHSVSGIVLDVLKKGRRQTFLID